jgi:hypothetical protein
MGASNDRREAWSKASRPYLLALLASVLIGILLRMRIIYNYQAQHYSTDGFLDLVRNTILTVYLILLALFLLLIFHRFLPYIGRVRLISRRFMRMLGVLASLQLVANLISVNVTIYRLKVESYELLAESFALYLSINLCFMFWYWYWDYPLRDAVFSGGDRNVIPQGIMFPEEQMEEHFLHTDSWLPGPVDYLYFTILSSNCFGSPEGHLLIGMRLKLLQIIHTIFMILVFIIIVARAINTLS